MAKHPLPEFPGYSRKASSLGSLRSYSGFMPQRCEYPSNCKELRSICSYIISRIQHFSVFSVSSYINLSLQNGRSSRAHRFWPSSSTKGVRRICLSNCSQGINDLVEIALETLQCGRIFRLHPSKEDAT